MAAILLFDKEESVKKFVIKSLLSIIFIIWIHPWKAMCLLFVGMLHKNLV